QRDLPGTMTARVLTVDKAFHSRGQDRLLDRTEQRIHPGGGGVALHKRFQAAASNGEMLAAHAQRPQHGPTGSVQNNFRADPGVWQRLAAARALLVRGELLFAEAVTLEPAPQRLAGAVADAAVVRRPDDVQAGAQRDVSKRLIAKAWPN